ncbi:MAG: glycosyltransferase [Clostridia bacterium]|nr:glycosyltransferase [Clostridia bacterium]
MPKVSVIVPVYNVEKYLRRCMESLVNQTLEDIEIIVVNDGSTDTSKEILKEYKDKYPTKIKYLEKENGRIV